MSGSPSPYPSAPRTHIKSHKREWRNIVTTCDNVLIAYRIVIARREREKRSQV